MQANEVQIGRVYNHAGFGQCTVVLRNRRGFWIQVWGGPDGDKLYTFKEINAADLTPIAMAA